MKTEDRSIFLVLDADCDPVEVKFSMAKPGKSLGSIEAHGCLFLEDAWFFSKEEAIQKIRQLNVKKLAIQNFYNSMTIERAS